MANIFFTQPDGKYAIFDTISDCFFMWDYDTAEQLKEDWIKLELEYQKEKLSNDFDRYFERMKTREPNAERMTWHEAKNMHNRNIEDKKYKIK